MGHKMFCKLIQSINRLAKEILIMSEVTDKLNAEIAKIAAKNYSGNQELIKTEVAAAITPVTQRVTDLEAALQAALEALNNDDPTAATEALNAVTV